jgi:tetratricopeptide (TPR) repeat protein
LPIAWERFARAMAIEAGDRRDNDVKLSLLQAAVDTDPNFAGAWAYLGILQNNTGNSAAGLASVTRAYTLRERATERERFRIAGLYNSLRYEFEKATEEFRKLITLYPFDDEGQRFYAQSLGSRLLSADSVQAASAAVELNPSVLNLATLINSFVQNGQGADALMLLDSVKRPNTPLADSLAISGGWALIQTGRYTDAENAFHELIRSGQDQLTNDAHSQTMPGTGW